MKQVKGKWWRTWVSQYKAEVMAEKLKEEIRRLKCKVLDMQKIKEPWYPICCPPIWEPSFHLMCLWGNSINNLTSSSLKLQSHQSNGQLSHNFMLQVPQSSYGTMVGRSNDTMIERPRWIQLWFFAGWHSICRVIATWGITLDKELIPCKQIESI